MTLEEAIEVGADECHCPPDIMRDALALMMPTIRAAVIEECARIIEGYEGWTGNDEWVAHMAAAVRALKDKP